MSLYEIELSGKVTVDVCESFPVKASSREEAIERAKAMFAEYLEQEFSMIYECKDVETGYVGILKHEI
jgi:hypothetical protein